MILLARLTSWDISYALAVNVILALGIFLVVIYQLEAIRKQLGITSTNWLIPIISLMLFSLQQWENWLWGFQMVVFMSVWAGVTGIFILSQQKLKWASFLAGMAFGIIATYSFANGMLYWPIGFAILFTAHALNKDVKKLYFLICLVISSAAVLLYFIDYQKPVQHPSMRTIFENPIIYILYIFSCLGAPVSSNYSAWFGGFGFFVLVITFLIVIRVQHLKFPLLAPYIGWSLYSLGSAIIIGIGRAGWGIHQAVSSRYITHANLFWITNLLFLYIVVTDQRFKNRIIKNVGIGIIISITLLTFYNSLTGTSDFREQNSRLLRDRGLLLALKDEEFQNDEIQEDVFNQGITIIKNRRLSVFREKYR
jgi:hypothetical protein